jgi:hypothetical protein
MEGFRFKVGESVVFQEEVLTIQKLTYVNGWPAYFMNEIAGKIPDYDLGSTDFLNKYKLWKTDQ